MTRKPRPGGVEEAGRVEEERWCWAAYLGGMSFDEMAGAASAHFGKSMSRATVHRRVSAERERARGEVSASNDEHRTAQLARLDALTKSALRTCARMEDQILRADELKTIDVHAEALLIKARTEIKGYEERRAKLLGLDAPTQVEATVTVKDATDLAMESLAAEMDTRAEVRA